VRAILRGGRQAIEIPRAAGMRKPLLKRSTFWKVLMEVIETGDSRYLTYSYKDHADIYQTGLSLPGVERLRSSARLVTYTSLRGRIGSEAFTSADLYVERS
jgi:hypothetical protein